MTDQAYAILEEQIVTLVLAPGQVLSENTLAGALGFGRTPIREALQRLAREGLIVILARRGVMVSEINVRNQLELLRVRRELERLMAQLAASRASNEERAAFQSLAEGMTKAARYDDDVAFMRLDRDLNRLISSASRNEYAQRAIALTHGLSRRFWYRHYQEVLDLPLCARLHAALARAISEWEVDEAMNCSDQLLDYIETFTRAALDAPMS